MAKMEGTYIQVAYKNAFGYSQPILDRFLWFKDRQLGKCVRE